MSQFRISEQNTPEQKALFENLNQALDQLGVTADEFDIQFRIQLMRACQNVALSAQPAVVSAIKSLGPAARKLVEQSTLAKGMNTIDAEVGKVIRDISRLQVIVKRAPRSADEVDEYIKIAAGLGVSFNATSTMTINQELGRFQDIPDDKLSEQQKKVKRLFSTLSMPQTIPVETGYTNLLQQVADGKPLVNNLGTFNTWQHLPEFDVESNIPANLICSTMMQALRACAHERGITGQKFEEIRKIAANIETNVVTMADAPKEPGANRPFFPLEERQRRFFTALHKVQKICGATQVHLDYNLRNRLSLLAFNIPYKGMEKLSRKVAEESSIDPDFKAGRTDNQYSRMNHTLDQTKITVERIPDAPSDSRLMDEPNLDRAAREHGLQLVHGLKQHFKLLTSQKLDPKSGFFDQDIQNKLHKMESRYGEKLKFEPFEAGSSLLSPHGIGERALFELSDQPTTLNYNGYKIHYPSQRALVLTAIEDAIDLTARNLDLDKPSRQKLREATDELRAAYAEAVLTPEQYAAKQEEARKLKQAAEEKAAAEKAAAEKEAAEKKAAAEQRAAELERQRKLQQEQDALRFIVFQLQGTARSIMDKGAANRLLPNKPNERAAGQRYQDVVSRELTDVHAAINRNYAPHLTLGNAVFNDNKQAAMNTLDTICLGKMNNVSANPGASSAADAIRQVLTLPDDGTPLYKANHEKQQQLVAALTKAPLLITAAIGTQDQISRQYTIQQQLFPERKNTLTAYEREKLIHERGRIASDALKAAGIELTDEQQARLVPAEPPEPPKPAIPEPVVVVPPVIIPPPPAPTNDTPTVDTPPAPTPTDNTPPTFAPEGDNPDTPPAAGAPRATLTQTEVNQRITTYVQRHLPDHHLIRMHLRQGDENLIVVTMGNAKGESQTPLYLRLNQPDINLALETFRRAEGHALAIPGVEAFVDPGQAVTPDAQLNEPIPNATPTAKTQAKHGSYYAQLTFPAQGTRPREVMSINLGLPNTPNRLQEAQRRAQRVVALIDEQRQLASTSAPYLATTKLQIGGYLRDEIQAAQGEWVQPQSQYIDTQFPASIKLNAPGNHWIHVAPQRQTGMVDNSWAQPISFVIDGRPLEAGNAEINLHVDNAAAARQRGVEVVNNLLVALNGAQFATDPAKPGHLRTLTPAERAAQPNLIDLPRLRRIQDQLRAPYQQDVGVIIRDRQTTPDGGTSFTLELTRGSRDNLQEPLRDGESGNFRILRHFKVEAGNEQAIDPFVTAVSQSVRDNLDASYSPATRASSSPDGVSREKSRLKYSPDRARGAFDRAIASARGNHAAIQSNTQQHAAAEDMRRDVPAAANQV